MDWKRIIGVAAMVLVGAVGSAQAQNLSQMAGQMILVGFQGSSVNAAGVRAVRDDIAAGRLGGIMYLRSNVDSLDGVAAINSSLRALDLDLPPFIALDQEGGSVERLTRAVGFAELPSAQNTARNMSPEAAQQQYASMATGLFELGFNVNFGPVVDLNINPNNPVIARYGRAYGVDASTVSRYARSFIAAHRGAGVLTALKHFPGHGSSSSDSHDGFVDVSESWREEELEPYRTLVAADAVDMVMVGHLYNSRDTTRSQLELPASLSNYWIDGILRTELGFDGVVVSDDMEMGAIRSLFSLEIAVVRAVFAGTDILLFSNTSNYRTSLVSEVHDILVRMAEKDPAFRARIEQSYARIVALKQRLPH